MVSIGALVLVALATPYVVVVTFAVLFAYGTDPPWLVSALLGLALAAPGLAGLLAFDQADVLDALAGSTLTSMAAIMLLNPELANERTDVEVIEGSRLHRYGEEVAPEDGPLASLLVRLVMMGLVVVGLYITADALVATPKPPTTYPPLL